MSKDSLSKTDHMRSRIYPHIMTIVVLLSAAIIFVVGQVLGIFLFTLVLSLAGYSTTEISDLFTTNSFIKFLGILLVELVSIGLIIAVIWREGNPLKFLKLDKKPTLSILMEVIKTYGMYLVSFIVVAFIGGLLINTLDVNQQQQLGYDYEFMASDYIWVFLTLVVLPPIAEEILFRGFLYRMLKSVTAKRIAIISTSVLFAVAHLEFLSGESLNWIAAVDTFVLSLFLIRLYDKTDNLWSSILLHALKNSIAFTFLFII